MNRTATRAATILAATGYLFTLTACGGQDVPSAGHPVTHVTTTPAAPTTGTPGTQVTPVAVASLAPDSDVATAFTAAERTEALRQATVWANRLAADCGRLADPDSQGVIGWTETDPATGADPVTDGFAAQIIAHPDLLPDPGSDYRTRADVCASKVTYANPDGRANLTKNVSETTGTPRLDVTAALTADLVTADGTHFTLATKPGQVVTFGFTRTPTGALILDFAHRGQFQIKD